MTGQPSGSLLGPDEVFILHTSDGSETLFSRQFNTTYHSIHGAVTESRHVFIQNGLLTQVGKSEIRILEFGFGTGLNAFLAWLYSRRSGRVIQYTGIESMPISTEIAGKLDYPSYLVASDQRDLFLRMHTETAFSKDIFSFRRLNGYADLPPDEKYDCIFFDAFDPSIQPEVWSSDIFSSLYNMTSEGGSLVTYSARGEVRRSLQKAGFSVERIPGPPGKREMLRAMRL